MKVTISGSYHKHFDRLIEAKNEFETKGIEVLRPHSEKVSSEDKNEFVRLEGDPDDVQAVQKAQLQAILKSDFVYVVNPGGYVGNAATLEIGYAHCADIPVITSEVPFEPAVLQTVFGIGSPDEALEKINEKY